LIEKVVPTLTPIDFDNALSNTKQDEWYKIATKNLKKLFDDEAVASYGEESALSILLMFAQVSLMISKELHDNTKQESLVKHSLSLILPTVSYHSCNYFL
jgi:hypothetical protein